jgi:Putative lumazine-binding
MARSADEHSHGSAAEREAILAVVLDYIAGWFDADAARVERALHPELCKRSLRPDGTVSTLTAPMLIEYATQGRGRGEDAPDRRVHVEVDHIDGALAAAVVRCHQYVDYMQLVRTAGGWKILNVLCRRRHHPATPTAPRPP